MGKIFRQLKKRSGSILSLAVMMVIILLFVGIGLIRLGLNARLQAIRAVAEISARSAADAGVTQAWRLMNIKLQDRPWDGTPIPPETDVLLPPSDSSFSYTVAPKDAESNYLVTSIGKSGNAMKTIYVKLFVETF